MCGSDFLYPLEATEVAAPGEVECRCPDCERTGTVVVMPLVAAVWRRRSQRAFAAMEQLAEAITADRAS
jgi:hypothetical protein